MGIRGLGAAAAGVGAAGAAEAHGTGRIILYLENAEAGTGFPFSVGSVFDSDVNGKYIPSILNIPVHVVDEQYFFALSNSINNPVSAPPDFIAQSDPFETPGHFPNDIS